MVFSWLIIIISHPQSPAITEARVETDRECTNAAALEVSAEIAARPTSTSVRPIPACTAPRATSTSTRTCASAARASRASTARQTITTVRTGEWRVKGEKRGGSGRLIRGAGVG